MIDSLLIPSGAARPGVVVPVPGRYLLGGGKLFSRN